MATLGKLFKGGLYFFLGYIAMVIINLIIPKLQQSLDTVYSGTNFMPYVWIAIIAAWLVFCIGVPLHLITEALIEGQGFTNSKIFAFFIAGGIFLFNLLITIRGWYMIEVFADLADTGVVGAIFWAGLIIQWVAIQLFTPGYILFRTLKTS